MIRGAASGQKALMSGVEETKTTKQESTEALEASFDAAELCPCRFWTLAREFSSLGRGKRLRESNAEPDTVLSVYLCDRAVRFSGRLAAGARGPGGRNAVSSRWSCGRVDFRARLAGP
jgi:hypothetical protein